MMRPTSLLAASLSLLVVTSVHAQPQPDALPGEETAPPAEPAPTPAAGEPEDEPEPAPGPPAAPEPAEEQEATTLPLEPVISIFSRFEYRESYTDLGRVGLLDSDAFRYRTRLGLQTTPISVTDGLDVVVRLVPEASGVWYVGGNTLQDVELGLHEGNLQIHGERWWLQAGRFEMVYGDHFVIGNVDWHPSARSFDGLRTHLELGGGAWTDVFFTVVEEGTAQDLQSPFGVGDVYFGGVYAGIGPAIDENLALDAYALVLSGPETRDDAGNEVDAFGRLTLGGRVKHRVGMLDYRTEVGVQLGKTRADQDIVAYQGDLELGVHLLDDLLRLGVEGFYASGDDPGSAGTQEGWNQLFPTAHKWLGVADIIGGRTDIAGAVLHVGVHPAEGWTVYSHGHVFFRPEEQLVANPADPMGPPVLAPDGYAGVEVDSGVAWKIGKGLKLRTNYSLFVPDDEVYASSDAAHFYELELRYDY